MQPRVPAYVEARSAPTLARRYPRGFTFYLRNPFPRFLLSLLNLQECILATTERWLDITSFRPASSQP